MHVKFWDLQKSLIFGSSSVWFYDSYLQVLIELSLQVQLFNIVNVSLPYK